MKRSHHLKLGRITSQIFESTATRNAIGYAMPASPKYTGANGRASTDLASIRSGKQMCSDQLEFDHQGDFA